MPRRGTRKPIHIAGDLSHPHGLGSRLQQFLEDLAVRNYAESTIRKRRYALNRFICWCGERQIDQLAQIDRLLLERYQQHLFHLQSRYGTPLSFRSQSGQLEALRAWFRWLTRRRLLLHNPASELELPRLPHRLPKCVLSPAEMEAVLDTANVSRSTGLRDRSMMETLYSCGIRRMELAHLQLGDVDPERGVVSVRQGKGRRDRVVPIGQRALLWLDKYLSEARPQLLVDPQQTALYLTRMGDAFSGSALSAKIGHYVRAAALGKQGSCHLFRHSMATAMHERGADVRQIQALLGHQKLDTTEIYTRVSIRHLQQVHQRTHPAEQPRTELEARDEVSGPEASKPEAPNTEAPR